MLASTLNFANNNPVYGCLLREVLGSNVPSCLLVKTVDEGVDKGIQQFASTAVLFGGGAVAHFAWDSAERLLKLPVDKQHFGRALGKTSAVYGLASFGLLAVPYLRNAITLQRTKKTGFVGFAGVDTQDKQALGQAELKQQSQVLLKQFAKTMRQGALFGGVCFAATQLFLRKVSSPIPMLKPITDRFLIEGGDYLKAGDAFALFTAIPAYIAFIAGARDKVERQEWLMKAAAFPLGVMLVPTLARNIFEKTMANKTFKWAGGAKNAGSLLQLGLSTGLYALITLLAMKTRTARAQKAGLTGQVAPQPKKMQNTLPASAVTTASLASFTSSSNFNFNSSFSASPVHSVVAPLPLSLPLSLPTASGLISSPASRPSVAFMPLPAPTTQLNGFSALSTKAL